MKIGNNKTLEKEIEDSSFYKKLRFSEQKK